jgi:DNA (cytosine-5)-methyltransferase 1
MRFLDDERGLCISGYVDVVKSIRPSFFLMENVTGMASADGGKIVDQIRRRFSRLGYSVSCGIVNAADYGVPQLRKRFIMIGRLGKKPVNLPEPSVKNHVDLRDAIADLENDPGDFIDFPPTIKRFMAKIPEGGNWKSLKPRDQDRAMGNANRKSGGLTAFYRRLSYERPSPTLLTSPSQRATTLCHPVKNRPLSIDEYKRIQCFPDSWEVAGSVRDQYRQLGNAVPVLLGESLGRALLRS